MRREKEEELNRAIEEMTTIQKQRIESSHFLTTESYACTLKNGQTILRDRLRKNGGDGRASIVLPLTKEGNTIITIQPRVFTKSTVGVGLPAGYVEEEETYEEAAKRELVEETGYVSENLIKLVEFYQDDGCSAAFNKGYLGLNCEKMEDQHLDSSEYIKYMECTWEELLELVERGYILDSGSQLLIEKAKQFRKERSERNV